MGLQLPDEVENIVAKEEIARYEQFLLFPQCFQKLAVVEYLWNKGLNAVFNNKLKLYGPSHICTVTHFAFQEGM